MSKVAQAVPHTLYRGDVMKKPTMSQLVHCDFIRDMIANALIREEQQKGA